MHDKNILHRDLKPSNILIVSKDIKVKLSDFGLAKELLNGKTFHQSKTKGTSGYYPFEVSEDQHSKLSDIFGLGCVFYELLTRG